MALTTAIEMQTFGHMPDGTPIKCCTLSNKNQMMVTICNYGGILLELRAPDRNGAMDNLVLGYDTLEAYLDDPNYFGALIGRYANRIARGRFSIHGNAFQVPCNEGQNHLHGGDMGFNRKVWEMEILPGGDEPRLQLSLSSPDGDQGYPGNLTATVHYTLTQANELKIQYSATADQPTPVNLTSHGYFNLAGAGSGDILGHQLMLHADAFTPVDDHLIPTGELRPVKGTPLDFTRPMVVGERIEAAEPQMQKAGGYDHNWVLRDTGEELKPAAEVYEPSSGRSMTVLTTEPGLQFYTGNFMDPELSGRNNRRYGRRSGLCLEAQHFPDSPNQPDFPSTLLSPGETYRQVTMYRFHKR